MLVDFFADWCGPCKKIAPQYEKLAGSEGICAVKCNVDEAEELAGKFGVESIPTFMVFKGSADKAAWSKGGGSEAIVNKAFEEAKALKK